MSSDRIFPDITETDREFGRLELRELFAVTPRRGGGMIVTDMRQTHDDAIRAKLIEMGWRPPGNDPAHKLNTDRTVAVATDYYWNEDMGTCPRGAKTQLLGVGGVATYGSYNGDAFWVAWAPLPKRRKS